MRCTHGYKLRRITIFGVICRRRGKRVEDDAVVRWFWFYSGGRKPCEKILCFPTRHFGHDNIERPSSVTIRMTRCRYYYGFTRVFPARRPSEITTTATVHDDDDRRRKRPTTGVWDATRRSRDKPRFRPVRRRPSPGRRGIMIRDRLYACFVHPTRQRARSYRVRPGSLNECFWKSIVFIRVLS